MRILYLSSHPNLNLAAPSGPGTHMREIIRAFESRGHEVLPLIAGGLSLPAQSGAIQFRKHALRKFIPDALWYSLKDFSLVRHDAKMRRRLEEIIDSFQPDLIYERAYYMITSGVDVASSRNITHFLEMNAPYPQERAQMEGGSWLVKLAKRKERTQVRKCNRIFVVSSALKDYLLRGHTIASEKIVITPNAVNAEYFSHAKREDIRHKFEFRDDHIVIGFVGSIFPYHGVDALVQAFGTLVETFPFLRLLIVGDGEILPQLKAYVADKSWSSAVVFSGNVTGSEVPDYIDAMDITVMARSNWYGSPVKLFEYGALGKMIIAPDNVPVRDVMENFKDGILVSESQQSLVDAIRFAIEQPGEARRMGMHFQQKVLSRHTWQQVGDDILKEAQ